MVCGSGGSKNRLGQMRHEKLNTALWRDAHFQVKKVKHRTLGPLLEVEMSIKCTPLWREAYFQVKMYKAHQPRSMFGS